MARRKVKKMYYIKNNKCIEIIGFNFAYNVVTGVVITFSIKTIGVATGLSAIKSGVVYSVLSNMWKQ